MAWMPWEAALLRQAILLITSLLLAIGSAWAQPGNIAGKVIDAKTKDPLPFANVIVVGTTYGAMSMEDGSFFIRSVPAGTYVVKASYMGYESAESEPITVEPYKTVEVNFRLYKTVLKATEEIVVTAKRPMVEVDVPITVRSVTEDELKEMPVTSLEDVLGLQAGIIKSDDEIHIRGGRTDETLYIVDGVEMKDLISGKSSLVSISARSVAEMDVITGGYSAEFGQALSGIVNVKLKEGGWKHKGYIEYSADHFPFHETPLDYFNTDHIEISLEGPEPLASKVLPKLGIRLPGQVTYFIGFSGDFSDTYLPSINDLKNVKGKGLRSSYNDNFFGIKINYTGLAPRAQNRLQAFGKLVWRASSNNKFGLSFTKTISIDQGYFRHDPYDVKREISGYQHEWSRRLDHWLTYTEDTNSLVFTWNHILNENSFYILRLSRFFNCVHADVAGKHWYHYEEPDDYSILGEKDTPYFIETGDADLWHDRYIESYNLSWKLTLRIPPHHQIKAGVSASYENAQFIIIRQPWASDPDSLGLYHDIFHIYPNTGAFFIQDKINYEGLIGNIGLRYDYWFPGEQVERAIADTSRVAITKTTREGFYRDTHKLFGRRFKGHLSPRIAISYPITERDNLFFNYGHFSQRPNYIYVYSKLSSVSSEQFPLIGNPNLDPEISVQYEFGARHQFTETVAADVTLFYKDIYDYPTSTKFEKPGVGSFFIYRNIDYARSRGIEIQVRRKKAGLWGGSITYTYSIATGKSSDPNTLKLVQEAGGIVGTGETSLAEEYLWWNRPHKLNIRLDLGMPKGEHRRVFGIRIPDDWRLSIHWLLQSGKAYTPVKDGREVGKRYSKNGPRDNILDLRLTKTFDHGKIKTRVYLEIKNVFNDRKVRRVDPETGEAYEIGRGSLKEEVGILYYIYKYSDPSLFGPPRQAKLGMGIEW